MTDFGHCIKWMETIGQNYAKCPWMAVGCSWLRQTYTERCRGGCLHTLASHPAFNSRSHDVTACYRRAMSWDQYLPWHWRCGWCGPALFINTCPSWWVGLGGTAPVGGVGRAVAPVPGARLPVAQQTGAVPGRGGCPGQEEHPSLVLPPKFCPAAFPSACRLPAAGSAFAFSWPWFNRAPVMQGFAVVLRSDTSCFMKCLEIWVILWNNWFHNVTVTCTVSRQPGDRVTLVALFSCSRGGFCSAFSQIKVSSPYKCYKACCLAINSCKW